jgi:hypothetical protein
MTKNARIQRHATTRRLPIDKPGMDEAAVFKQAPVFMARFDETARQQVLKSTRGRVPSTKLRTSLNDNGDSSLRFAIGYVCSRTIDAAPSAQHRHSGWNQFELLRRHVGATACGMGQ